MAPDYHKFWQTVILAGFGSGESDRFGEVLGDAVLIRVSLIFDLTSAFFGFLRRFISNFFNGVARLLRCVLGRRPSVLCGFLGFMAGILQILLWRVLCERG
jgi:hypothetical protein